MKKFDSAIHAKLIEKMPFSYLSTAVYLDFCAYLLPLNGEDLVVTQDPVYRHDFPGLFLPQNPLNWQFMSASMVFREDLQKIRDNGIEIATHNPTETEFIYSTRDFLNPVKTYKQKINQFEKGYRFEILDHYDRQKIIDFCAFWEKQTADFENCYTRESRDFFLFCLDNLGKYGIEQIYVEVEGKLAGFVWGVQHSADKWVSLHIKSDYQFRGLSRFLNYRISKKFADTSLASLGTGCQDPGLIKNKKELGPIEEKQYFYVLTRGKL